MRRSSVATPPAPAAVTVAAAVWLVAVACTGGEPSTGTTSTSPTTASARTTATTAPDPDGRARLTVRGAVLGNPLTAGGTFRAVVASAASEIDVVLPLEVPVPGARLRVCPVADLAAPRPPDPECAFPVAGDRATVAHAPDHTGVDVGMIATAGRGGIPDRVTLGEIVLLYTPRGPATVLALPPLPAGAAVTVTRSPAGTAPFRATATWDDAEARGELVLEAGPSVTATADGPPPLEASSQVSPAAPPTLRFTNTGAGPLPGAVLTVTWP